MRKVVDLAGKIINGIKIIERSYEKQHKDKYHKIYWKCICHCGNEFIASGNNLKSGNTKSCGCVKNELISKIGRNNSKTNKWIFEDNIAVGITNSGKVFMIDKEDFEKVKDYCWRFSVNGYVVANSKDLTNSTINIHRLILNPNKDEIVDHKDWNKADNRKLNLRVCSKSQNNVNIKRKKNNTSGYTGVKLNKQGNWVAQISFNNKRIHLGTYDNFYQAVQIRHKAEILMHQEFNGEINRKDFSRLIEDYKNVSEDNE